MPGKIAVVGAGAGGLSCAARLARDGYDVHVFEKLDKCGGRNHLLEDKGFKFDMGPSFVLMPDFFAEAFSYCGEDLKDYLDLKVLDVNYKIFYPDGDILNVYKDSSRTKEELERLEKGSSKSFDRFIKETSRIYGLVRPLLYKCFTPVSLVNLSYWPLLLKLKVFESYWGLAGKFFKTDKLRYAFTFEAMFMGVSPYQAPAFYSIISYTDHVQKIAHPMGGMYQIPLALERMAKKFGAKFHYNSEVEKISANGSIKLKTGEKELDFDKVVINADYAYAKEKLLGQALPDYRYSCSVYLIYLGLKKKVEGVEHHNLFFAKELTRNLSDIFNTGITPDDPSFYVHVPTVTDQSLAPQGKDIFYILVPVPNLLKSKEDFSKLENRLRDTVIEKINQRLKISLEELIEVEHRFYPQDFTRYYNIKFGATFGLAHNLMQSAFFRPPNSDSRNKNVYFVGASTQPGGGLPVVLAGSRIVADLINKG
ncbi:MAG: phytoene desaturase family protein [Candidatus Omnitrophica bacterium]|nr:phytoene desaturase family protein [Candidatus Omnitrophota bacterium]